MARGGCRRSKAMTGTTVAQGAAIRVSGVRGAPDTRRCREPGLASTRSTRRVSLRMGGSRWRRRVSVLQVRLVSVLCHKVQSGRAPRTAMSPLTTQTSLGPEAVAGGPCHRGPVPRRAAISRWAPASLVCLSSAGTGRAAGGGEETDLPSCRVPGKPIECARSPGEGPLGTSVVGHRRQVVFG